MKSFKVYDKKTKSLMCMITCYDKKIYNEFLKKFKKNKFVFIKECDVDVWGS